MYTIAEHKLRDTLIQWNEHNIPLGVMPLKKTAGVVRKFWDIVFIPLD